MEAKQKCHFISFYPHNFPVKLWHLVNDSQVYSVYWDDSGESILINQQCFEAEVLFSHTSWMSKFFKTTNFSSFIRQLNLYGFRKVRLDHDAPERRRQGSSIIVQSHHFQNPNFKRDKPELLARLNRLTRVNKAKLKAGIELTNRASRRFYHVKLPSTQDIFAVMKKGSVSVPHQGTPHHHHCYGPQLVMERNRLPKFSQAFAVSHVYQCRSPGLLDSNMAVSQPRDASCSPSGYYSDYSGSLTEQSPDGKAGDAPGSSTSEAFVDLDTVFKMADEMQAAANI